MKKLIRNGTVVTSSGIYKADIVIENEKIIAIKDKVDLKKCNCNLDEIIDAKGMYVLPGAIDPHTHLDMPFMGVFSTDNFETGSIAAACGGITSFIDFKLQSKGESLGHAIDEHKKIAVKSAIDYSFHPCITDLRPEVLAEIKDAVYKYGTPSFKMFMTYSFRIDDAALIKVLGEAKKQNGLVQLHAENYYVIEYMNELLAKEGKLEPWYHAKSRPNLAEEEAIYRAIKMAQLADAPLYIVHLSSKEGLEKIIEARDKGQKVYCETCPQYLVLNEDCYKEPNWNGAKYVMSPPLRSKASNEALWKGLGTGDIQVIATDHCPFNFKGIKDKFGKDDYKKIPNGAPGIETSLMLLHSEGVVKKRITLQKMVEVMSTNTARIFGMKDKGAIEVGKDADIVIFNPKQKFNVSYKKLHMNVDYNPYEGMNITGMPHMVFSRGLKVAQWNNDRVDFTGEPGRGKFIKRMPFNGL